MMNVKLCDSWDGYLKKIPDENKDIYYTEDYIKLYESEGARAHCAVCEDGDKLLLMPFIVRNIRGYHDFETVYGYGGAIVNTSDKVWSKYAFDIVRGFLYDEKYVCGFVRFHPLLNNYMIVRDKEAEGMKSQVIFDRHTVFIDTDDSLDNIWMNQISSKNRNMVRKAEKNGLIYASEYDFKSLEEFKILYNGTMKRLDADSFYFFNEKYYRDFTDKMTGKAFLGTVRKDGKLICAALFMYSIYYGHYHLEGSDRAYSSLGANNLLLWKAACEMHNLGVRKFHLGGVQRHLKTIRFSSSKKLLVAI